MQFFQHQHHQLIKDYSYYEWLEYNEKEMVLTKEEFMGKIGEGYVTISVTGEEYEMFFEDCEELFGDHEIVYNGNITKEDFCVDLVG